MSVFGAHIDSCGDVHVVQPGQAAKQLQVSSATIYRHVRAGTLPATKFGSALRISHRDLIAWGVLLEGSAEVEAPVEANSAPDFVV